MNARNTIRLTGLPLLRDGDFPCSPAYETALRTSGWLELSIRKLSDGHFGIYLTSDLTDYTFLDVEGINYTPAVKLVPAPRSLIALGREMQKVTLSNGTGPAKLEYRLLGVRGSADRQSFWAALDKADDGAGFSIFIRRHNEALPTKLLMRLSGSGQLVNDLKLSAEYFDVIGGIYAKTKEDIVRMTREVQVCWGLKGQVISPTETVPELLIGQIEPLSTLFLPDEVRALTALVVSSASTAVPVNKDTIPGCFTTPCPPLCEGLRLGQTARGEPVIIPWRDVSRHIVLFGPPGSGKTNTLFNICEQLFAKQAPTLVLEPAKNEFCLLQAKWHSNVWRPSSFPLNPFAVPTGVTLGQYRATLLSILETSFNLDGPLFELCREALMRCFARAGWESSSTPESPEVQPFGLHEFAIEFSKLLYESDYSDRVKADIGQAGRVRFTRLFTESDAFDSVKTVPVDVFLRGINIIQTYELTSMASKQLVLTFILLSIAAYIRLTFDTAKGGDMLKLVILIDEAHNLFSENDPTGFSVLFASLLLELRSLGVAFIIADQSSENIPRIVANTPQHKVFLSGAHSSGIANYADEFGLDEAAMKNLWRFGTGEGLYFAGDAPHAVYFHAPDVLSAYINGGGPAPHPANPWLDANPRYNIECFAECTSCPIRGSCSDTSKSKASLAAQRLAMELGSRLITASRKKDSRAQGEVLAQLEAGLEALPDEITRHCGLVQFVRLLNRRGGPQYSVEALQKILFKKRKEESST